MTAERKEIQEPYVIKPIEGVSLQDQINKALALSSHIILEGEFSPDVQPTFSMVTIPSGKRITLEGDNALLNGNGLAAHIVFVEDGASVQLNGIHLTGGNTGNKLAMISRVNHPNVSLNRYRYLDGGAISMGNGSVVELNDCHIKNNSAGVCGGGISNLGGCLFVNRCVFQENSCGDTGAAIDNLSPGSLAIIRNSTFINNEANLLGEGGTYGAITTFPKTFLFVEDSDLSGEQATAIDRALDSHMCNKGNIFNTNTPEPIVTNPEHSSGTRWALLSRYAWLTANNFMLLNKRERIPVASNEVLARHESIYFNLINNL